MSTYIYTTHAQYYASYVSIPTHLFFFFNDPATTEIYTLSLHDALPIFAAEREHQPGQPLVATGPHPHPQRRSEEHTSELQSRSDLVCRLLLENKKNVKLRTFYRLADSRGKVLTANLPSIPTGVGRQNLDMEVIVQVLFFNDTATTEIYTLSLHDALPI